MTQAGEKNSLILRRAVYRRGVNYPSKIALTAVKSASDKDQLAAATLAWIWSGLVAPAMTDATVGLCRSHEKASSRIVRPRASEKAIRLSTISSLSSVRRSAKRGADRRVFSGAACERKEGQERAARRGALGEDASVLGVALE